MKPFRLRIPQVNIPLNGQFYKAYVKLICGPVLADDLVRQAFQDQKRGRN